jgi:mono/diheme cytochrome c family protein
MKPFPRKLARCAPLLVCAGAFLLGCAADVDLAAVPQAVAGCEAPTDDELVPEAPMLPGRHCIACHNPMGQASRRVWTAAGTVFDSPTANCNTGGIDNVKVEILDPVHNNQVIITLYTNRTGNFFTAEPRNFTAITARVSKDGKMRQMQGTMATADCIACHYPGGAAGGRIYLN